MRHLPPAPCQPWLCQQDPWQVSTKFTPTPFPPRDSGPLWCPAWVPGSEQDVVGLPGLAHLLLVCVFPALPSSLIHFFFLSFLPPPWSLLPHVLVSIGFFVPKAEESSQKAFPLLRPRDGHEFEQTLRGGEGQGSLACCSPWSRKESDTTERLNSNNNREGTRNQRWLLRSCSSTRGV